MAAKITLEQARKCYPGIDALLASRPPDEAAVQALSDAGQPVAVEVEHAPGRWTVKVANWHPASDNLRARGWKAFAAAKKRDRAVIRDWLVSYARVPRATGRRRLSAWVTKRGPLVDGQNLWKSLADGLVNVGLLVDDGPDWFEAGLIAVARGAEVSTVLLLEDLA